MGNFGQEMTHIVASRLADTSLTWTDTPANQRELRSQALPLPLLRTRPNEREIGTTNSQGGCMDVFRRASNRSLKNRFIIISLSVNFNIIIYVTCHMDSHVIRARGRVVGCVSSGRA